MHILDACNDQRVFAPAFRDKRSWTGWFAFLAALFGLPITPEQLAVYQACTGRSEPPSQALFEAWLVVGRRGGKSFILALIAVFLACFKDWRPYLAVGERATVMIIASDKKQARVIMRYVKGLLQLVPMLANLIEAERAEAVDLSNGVNLEIHTASFRATRGYTVVAALLDEIAFWPTDDASEPDFEVLNAIRPAMATVPGAMLLCASTPYARRGSLYQTFQQDFGHVTPRLVWKADTRTMNPSVSQAFLDAEYEKDPVSAAAEYGAEFRADIASYISREALEAAVNWRALEHAPIRGRKYFAFTDPAGGSGQDAFTLAIAHKDGVDHAELDCIRERKPPFSPEAVVIEFAELLKSYRVTRIKGDRFSGEWVRESFAKHGIRYDPAVSPKSDLYRELLPLVNSERVKLLNHKRLISELAGLERRTSRAGRDSIDHAPGGHDDLANACAGVLVEALRKKAQVRIGTYGMGGRVSWKNEEPEQHSSIRIVTITEREDLRQRGLL